MARPKAQDPSAMLAMLIGVEGAEVLELVEEGEGLAFGIQIETPLSETTGLACGGAIEACNPITQDLLPTTACPARVLIRWKRRQRRYVDAGCRQEVFGERSKSVHQSSKLD